MNQIGQESATQPISIIAVHQFDFDWIGLLVDRLHAFTDLPRHELIIVNNDRTAESRLRLEELSPHARILEFPPDLKEIEWRGHDHGSGLDQAIQRASHEIIAIFDSDAHPLKPSWLPRSLELLASHALVGAQDPHQEPGICHPCFMVFRREAIKDLRMRDFRYDVGRGLCLDLRSQGRTIRSLAYRKIWPDQGFIYEGLVYHHGKGSWYNARNRSALSDAWVSKSLERKERILRGKYSPNFFESFPYRYRRMRHWVALILRRSGLYLAS